MKQLAAVTGLSAKAAGLNKVQLSWNASSGADGYLILGLNKNRTGKQIGYTVKTSWIDIGADSTSWNYYWVIPFYKDAAGTIIQGKLSKYVYALGRTIGKVTSVTTKATKEGVNLSWSSVDNANAYVVLSKTGSPTAAYNLPYTTTGRDIIDTEAKTGQVMYYWVYAVYCDYVGRVLVAGPVSPFAWAVAK